jgi:hypothetical protein
VWIKFLQVAQLNPSPREPDAMFLQELVEKRFVPAILIPAQFPNPLIYSLLASRVSPVLYSSVIT